MKPAKRAFFILLCFAIVDIAALGVYVSLFIAVKEKNERIAASEENIKAIADKDSNLRSVKNLVLDTSETRAKINTFMIPQGGEVDFLEEIEALGRIAGVSLEVVSVENEDGVIESAADLDSFRLHLEATGGWNSVYRFLRLLEELPVRSVISQARMEYIEGEKGIGSYWRAEVHFRALKNKISLSYGD